MIELVQYLNSEGYDISSVIPNGQLHRFKTSQNDKRLAGWYIAHQHFSSKTGEPFYVIVHGSWRGEETKTHCTLQGKIEKSDRDLIQKQLNEASRRQEAERLKIQEAASVEAESRWNLFSDTGESEYLNRKQINDVKDLGVKFNGSEIIVPARDIDGRMWSYQKISQEGAKRFYFGGRVRGCFHIIGPDIESAIYICEGFATGASIYQATKTTVVVAFNASNLVSVATDLRKKYKEAEIIICGDDDKCTDGNPGREKANEASEKSLSSVVFPKFKNNDANATDFNDLHILYGIDEVKKQLENIKPKDKLALYSLGFKEGEYFFTSTSNRQIVGVSNFSNDNLLKLMPIEYWQAVFPNSKDNVDWEAAKSQLMMQCRAKGIFNGNNIRGSGVWSDGERIVVNMGDYLLVDGVRCDFGSINSKFYYTLATRLAPIHVSPLNADDCQIFIKACQSFKWKKEEYGMLLAGSLVVSRVCGALPIRPHLWITGGAETGKSTLLEKLVKRALGPSTLYAHGSTTEAAIRQDLKANAVPILFDEFETNDQASYARISSVLDFLRVAWSESGASIIKGGATGSATRYFARSCAIVSSIRTKLINDADKGRFSEIELAPHGADKDHWVALSTLLREINDDYCERLFARTIRLIPVLLKNFELIKDALSQRAGSRFGDQYGMLLAGYSILLQDEPISKDEAEYIASAVNLDEQKENSKSADHQDALSHLLTTKINYDTLNGKTENLVGKLIGISRQFQGPEYQCDARVALLNLGIRVDLDSIAIVACNHAELETRVWRGTKWSHTWGKSLVRLNGALKKKMRIDGLNCYAITIPYSVFDS